MRLVWALTVASVARVASSLAINHAKAGYPSSNIESAVELKSDQPSSVLAERSEDHEISLEKRVRAEIPIPQNVAEPASILKMGLVISFTMVGRWVRDGTRNVLKYTCKAVNFTNGGNVQKTLTVTSGLVTYLENKVIPDHRVEVVKAAPEGFKGNIEVNIY